MAMTSEQQQRERGKADQRVGEVDRPVADHEQDLVHAPCVADLPANANEEGTFMVNGG